MIEWKGGLPDLPPSWNLLEKRSLRYGASALSGVFLFACFPRLNLHLLVWVACLPLLLALLTEKKLRHAFFLGYLSGAIYWAGSCYWFVEVMRRYGGVNPLLGMGAFALFLAVFSTFYGAFGLVTGWVARRSMAVALALSPFLWVTMELARTYLLLSFPWNLLGYAVQATGLRQAASFTAVYGLSFLAAATSALLAWVLLAPREVRPRIAAGVWFLLLVVGNVLLAPSPLRPGSNAALLLQPNVPLDEPVLEKWEPWRDLSELQRLVTMSLASRAALASTSAATPLVVWAENPAPFYFTRDPIFRAAIENLARQTRAYVVFNTVTFAGEDTSRPKNSAVALDPEGRVVLQYDKIHLVPFGEYVPDWPLLNKTGKIASQVGNYVPGSNYAGARTADGTIGIFICYESIFPQLVRRLTPEGPGVLVTISNDAWYGDSSAAYQHLEMARLRAIEEGRYLLRATNDGITAVIDPYGRVTEQIARHRATVMPGRYDYLARQTFYKAHGDLFAWLCVLASAAMITVGASLRVRPR